MSVQKVVEQVLSELTLPHLREVILRLAKKRSPEDSAGVPFFTIVDALVAERDLGDGAEGWRARMKVKRAVIEMVSQIPHMLYVEGDA